MGEYQVKYSEASQFFSQTPCGYCRFPFPVLIWFIPQSQLVFAVRSVGGKACEEVLTTIHPSRVILFSELFWMGGGNSSPIQQRVFRTLLLLFFVRQIYIRKSEHLEKVQEQTELQVSAWTRQILTTTTNLSSAQLSCVLVIHEILFIPQGLVLWLFSSMAHAQVK